MKDQDYKPIGATWVGTSVKSQKALSGEELALRLNEAIQVNKEDGAIPLSIHPVQGAVRVGIVTKGFLVVWGEKETKAKKKK